MPDHHPGQDGIPLSSRREFLRYAGASLLCFAGSAALWKTPRSFAQNVAQSRYEFLAVCDTQFPIQSGPYSGEALVTPPGQLRMFEVATDKISTIDLPFFGHTVTQNPHRLSQLVSFEKWGLRGALVDSQAQTILATAVPAEGNLFFGHAVFSADGGSVITTEDSVDRRGGQLVLRDAGTLKIIERRSSYGARPHECRSHDGGKTVVTVNQGDKTQHGSVTWVDWQSGRLLSKIVVDPRVKYGYSHIDFAPDGWMCLGGSMEPAGLRIAFISPEGRFVLPDLSPEIAARIKGEALSIAFLGDSGLVAVTVLASKMIMVFDYKKQALSSLIDCVQPKGILAARTETGETGIFFTGVENDDLFFANPYSAETRIIKKGFGGNGAHMTRFYV